MLTQFRTKLPNISHISDKRLKIISDVIKKLLMLQDILPYLIDIASYRIYSLRFYFYCYLKVIKFQSIIPPIMIFQYKMNVKLLKAIKMSI